MGRSKNARILNLLTLAAIGAWLASLVIRTLNPATTAAFISVDPVVLLIIGYWFNHNREKNGGNGS